MSEASPTATLTIAPGLREIDAHQKVGRLRRYLSSALCVSSVLVAGCTDPNERASPSESRVVRYGTGTPMQTFDPHRADTGPVFSTYLALVYDGLTRTDPENIGKALPALAQSWEWVDDVTLEFELRDDVRFVDGEPFNAFAAKANIERMIAAEGPRASTVASIKSAEATDEFLLRLHLSYSDPTVTYNLGLSPGMMVSPAAFDDPHLDLNPVGTGPWIYDFDSSTIGDVHRFKVNPNYFGGHPLGRADYEVRVLKDSRARLNALVSGQIDFAVLGPSESEYAKRRGFGLATRMSRWMGMTIIDRNGEVAPALADVRVRRAIGYAVDRQALADVVFFGFAEPRSQPMATLGRVEELDDYFYYDPEKARALLKEANIDDLHFVVPVLPVASAGYEAIQHYLKQVGINMEIEVVEPGSFAALARTRRFPVNTIGYPNYDPDSRHLAIWGPDATYNPFELDTARLEELAARARKTLDEDLREQLFEEYFRIVVTEVYSLVFVYVMDVIAYDAERLVGVRVSSYIDPYLREVTLLPEVLGE